jgi:hypothetical protein
VPVAKPWQPSVERPYTRFAGCASSFSTSIKSAGPTNARGASSANIANESSGFVYSVRGGRSTVRRANTMLPCAPTRFCANVADIALRGRAVSNTRISMSNVGAVVDTSPNAQRQPIAVSRRPGTRSPGSPAGSTSCCQRIFESFSG